MPSLFLKTLLIISFINSYCVASVSERIHLVGKITSFDEKNVEVISGNRIYIFLKSNLKFPSYKVGDEIKIELSKTELDKLKSRSANRKSH